MLHAGDARGVVDAVEAEEGAVRFAQTAETELQHGFGERRLRADGGAAADVGGGSEQNEIDEVAAGDRQVEDVLLLNDLADLRDFGVDALAWCRDFDLLLRGGKAQA